MGVVKGAGRFLASWHSNEEGKSQNRATKRATKTSGQEKATTKGAEGGQRRRGETAPEESKREEADRVARHVAR